MTRVHIYADVAELADALDSGSSEGNFMWVQVPSSAPKENGLLGIIPKSPFSFDFMRQNRLISFLSHELDVKKHFGFRRKFVTLCVINSQKQMRFLHSCKDEFCWLFYFGLTYMLNIASVDACILKTIWGEVPDNAILRQALKRKKNRCGPASIYWTPSLRKAASTMSCSIKL